MNWCLISTLKLAPPEVLRYLAAWQTKQKPPS